MSHKIHVLYIYAVRQVRIALMTITPSSRATFRALFVQFALMRLKKNNGLLEFMFPNAKRGLIQFNIFERSDKNL